MKERVTHNFGLKMLSVVLAALLWLVVINSQDPVETVTFEDIPVTIINEDALTAKDKIPEVVEGDSVSVVVEARRSICDKLTKADIIAVADFEKVSVTDAVPIDVSVKGYTEREVEIVRGMNQMMKLRLEDSISKDFRIKISTTGQAAEGYVIGDMVASPNMITLTGSGTQISKVKEVVLMVDVDKISSESHATGVPVIYDMNGDIVNSSKVVMSAKEVSVVIPVLKTQTVKINVVTEGEPAPGYEVGPISHQPEYVTVAGMPTDLVLLGTTLTAKVNITDQSGVVEENIDIASLWDESLDSLRIVDEDKLAVTVTMQEYQKKVFELTPEDVELRGLPENFTDSIGMLYSSRVQVRGSKASLEGLTLDQLAPYIDLIDIAIPGSYRVNISLENQGDLILDSVLTAMVDVEYRPQVEEPDSETNPDTDVQGTGDDTANGGAE